MKAECAVIGSFNLLRASEKRSSNFSQGSGKMVLESGQRGELKTFQAKERMYKGKTQLKRRTAMYGCAGCALHNSGCMYGGGIHIAVYVQYGGPVRGQGKFGE